MALSNTNLEQSRYSAPHLDARSKLGRAWQYIALQLLADAGTDFSRSSRGIDETQLDATVAQTLSAIKERVGTLVDVILDAQPDSTTISREHQNYLDFLLLFVLSPQGTGDWKFLLGDEEIPTILIEWTAQHVSPSQYDAVLLRSYFHQILCLYPYTKPEER